MGSHSFRHFHPLFYPSSSDPGSATASLTGSGGIVKTEDDFPAFIPPQYERIRFLGAGGMGRVYLYLNTELERFEAVKRIPGNSTSAGERSNRFLHEARLLAAVNDQHVATIYDVVNYQGMTFLRMEYVPGVTLAREIRENGKLSVDRAMSVGSQIAMAILAGHRLDPPIIHRDIKPGNIMITPHGQVKLLDFGIGQRWNDDVDAACESSGMSGTYGYMSPEQIQGQPTGKRGDVWGFGCVLYEMLTGHRAFPGASTIEIRDATLNRNPDFDALPRKLLLPVADLLQQCLNKQPEHRLADINEAVAILNRRFDDKSSARPARIITHNLPIRRTTFVDRPGEMSRLLETVRQAPLLTLWGPGGSGKTRLALELARRAMLEESKQSTAVPFPDGVWWVDLSPLTDAAQVIPAIATVLKAGGLVDDDFAAPNLQALLGALTNKQWLIVLDNCEHVLDACREVIESIVPTAADSVFVATSREPLGLSAMGERIHRVSGLAFPDPDHASIEELLAAPAVALFIDRARQVREELTISQQNIDAIAAICRQVDGIPLAIELAAARVGSMPITQIADHLSEVLDPADILKSSIEWSVRLLSRAQRALLWRLSVFRGGWTGLAAETVCTNEENNTIEGKSVSQLLGRLVDRSLVIYEEQGDRHRYRMLETVREFASQKLARSNITTEITNRHLQWCIELATLAEEKSSGPEQAAWLDRIESEHDNMRAALSASLHEDHPVEDGTRLARALHLFWYVHGYAREGYRWIKEMLDRRADAKDLLQLRTNSAAGTLATSAGFFDEADRHYQAALMIAETLNDQPRIAGVLTNLGLLALEMTDLPRSRSAHERAIDVYQQIDNKAGAAMAQLNLAVTAKQEGALEQVRSLLQSCLPVFTDSGDKHRIAAAHSNLGQLALLEHHYETALQELRVSLALFCELSSKKEIASMMMWIGATVIATRHYERGARLLGAAENLRKSLDIHLSPFDTEKVYESACRSLDENLDAATQETCWARGRTQSFNGAVDEALNVDSQGQSQKQSGS